ncbi:MAG TPA: GAF domain-containing protein [Abditibacteriaceae bacterium]
MTQSASVASDDRFSSAYLDAVLNSSADAIFIVDSDGRIRSWNKGARQMMRYSADEIIGSPINTLLPASAPQIDVQALLESGKNRIQWDTVPLTKYGDPIDVTITAVPLREAGRPPVLMIIARDVSAHRRTQDVVRELEIHAQHRALILETASRVALDILSSRTGIEALRHIADAARILAGARYAALGVAYPDTYELAEFVTVGLTPEEEAAIGPRPRGAGVLGLLLRRTEPLRVDVLADHPESVGFPPNHPPMDTFLGVPIRRGDTVIGSLYLTNKQGGGPFTEADEVAVQALGAHAAIAIHNMALLGRQRGLMNQLITIQEEERSAVAYDLHDGLTQFVMASHAHLESFQRAHESGNEEKAQRELGQGLKYLKEAVVESRRLVNGLRSLSLDDLGLSGAIEQLLREEKVRCGWERADLVDGLEGERFDKALETGAYRVAQEALTNVRKHAESARVQVTLRIGGQTGGWSDRHLVLEVVDWGKGFDSSPISAGGANFGLHSMSERAQLLGGRFNVQSAPGKGTLVQAYFPIAAKRIKGSKHE